MCGICGVFSATGETDSLKKAVVSMNQSQVCRGPDDEGFFTDSKGNLIFGHRRLSIIDLSKAGRGPMGYDAGKLEITLNGEIYNFLELRQELGAKGYKFKTQTDTEVVLALYADRGPASFSKLRGMFAFALWDSEKRKLFLVKDRYGIKPLYYYSDSGKLVFASTVKAIQKSGLIPLKKSPEALIGFSLFGSVPLPLTTLRGVFAVPPGHYLVRGADGKEELIKYYDCLESFLRKSDDSFETAVLKTKNLLTDSVKKHLISDAPLGVFLSGGLDSSVVAALASVNQKESLHTLSVVFDEPEFSEKKYQDLVAQKIKSNHHEIKITKQDFLADYDSIFEAMDQPTIDGVNTFFISKAAKEAGLKVVLSGLGSDEIFYGYSNFKKAELFMGIQKLPKIFKLPLKVISPKGNRYSKLNYLLNKDILSFYLGLRGLFSPKETAKILNINLNEVENFLNEILITQLQNYPITELHPVDLLSYLELKFYLQNQLLKDTDFMSMYHSIEVRVPFLDHPLVEYLSGLSPGLKLSKNINKPLLTGSVKDLLPREILNRKKMGFTFPFQKWLNVKDGRWARFWAREVLKKWQ